MIWSLFKIVLFVLLITLLSWGASLIVSFGTEIRIVVANWEITMTPIVATVCIVLLIPVVWLTVFLLGFARALFRFVVGDETALSRYLNRNKEQRGFEALADGLLALASGEPKLAMTKAVRAENLLRRPDLTGVISAQAAERAGERQRAVEAYKRLLKDDRTKFVGISGLLKFKLEEGDTAAAFRLAERAFTINPRHEDIQNMLLGLQSGEQDWEGASRTLAAKYRYKKIPRELYQRRNAVLSLADAKDKLAKGKTREGEEAAYRANRDAPGLVPAAVLAAEIRIKAGEKRTAARILKRAWSNRSHPDIAAAFAAIEPDESPAARRVRFSQLVAKGSTDPEARMLLAELAIADSDFAVARRVIGSLPKDQPTVRSLVIMAAIERGEGTDEAVVRAWLARAVSASRGNQWICQVCNNALPEWVPVCGNCKSLDTLEWKEAPDAASISTTPTGLLPLIIESPIERETSQEDDELTATEDRDRM